MGLKNGAYATVWDVKPLPSGKAVDLRISVSAKNRDGKWEQDFGGYVRIAGEKAAARAAALKVKDRIRVGDFEVTRRYDRGTGKEYTNFIVFGFEKEASRADSAMAEQMSSYEDKAAAAADDDDDLPF